jgi:hypothetical protein
MSFTFIICQRKNIMKITLKTFKIISVLCATRWYKMATIVFSHHKNVAYYQHSDPTSHLLCVTILSVVTSLKPQKLRGDFIFT